MVAQANPTLESDEKYHVVASLGRGGTADVSLAVARGPGGFNKLVVLKSLREEFRGDENFSEMFMNEARLNALLSHPHIVQTLEVFEFDGLPVIVMEYLEGPSLSAAVRGARKMGPSGQFNQTMHLRVLSDTLSALHYAHNRNGLDGEPLGLVHCDVTPQNILLTYEGEVKLIDFGIAQQVSADEQITAGSIKGKARYMPPEQLGGIGVDRRADIYAVGVMAWEAAAGVRLWEGATDEEMMYSVMSGVVPTPSSVARDVDPELERIVMKALQTDKRHRYSTARAMQVDLDAFLGDAGRHLRGREIGEAMVLAFSDRRAHTRSVVAAQLARLESIPADERNKLPPVELPRVASLSFYPSELPPPSATFPRRTVALLVGVLFVLLGALGQVLWIRSHEKVASKPTQHEDSVELSISALPREAQILIDGVPVGSNPFMERRSSSDKEHHLLITAEGYLPEERALSLLSSTSIVVNLGKRPTPGLSLPELEKESPGPLVAPPRTKETSCDPPAYFDDKGIKHFKPHCL